jgi:IS1 family transposase
VIAITFGAKSQNRVPRVTPSLDKFEGTWVYKKADSVFTVILKKNVKIVKDAPLYTIEGNYKLTVKNIESPIR